MHKSTTIAGLFGVFMDNFHCGKSELNENTKLKHLTQTQEN